MIRMLEVRKFSKILVKYEHIKKLAVESGIDEKKIVVIPFWVDVETINKKSKNNLRVSVRELKAGDIVLGYFARLDPQKGPFLLLKAFSSLAKKASNIKLVFIGGGPPSTTQELKELCSKLHLQDKVVFLGAIPYETVHTYLSIPDIFVFPSPYKNYEWALAEAMCANKPIVATNVAGTSEILIDRYNAVLTSPTVDSLTAGILNVLDDPALAKKIGENAFGTVKSKHSYKNLEKYEEVLKSLD